ENVLTMQEELSTTKEHKSELDEDQFQSKDEEGLSGEQHVLVGRNDPHCFIEDCKGSTSLSLDEEIDQLELHHDKEEDDFKLSDYLLNDKNEEEEVKHSSDQLANSHTEEEINKEIQIQKEFSSSMNNKEDEVLSDLEDFDDEEEPIEI
ncbi:hypothetical protein KI387_030265, partial [Taxus chinensis]